MELRISTWDDATVTTLKQNNETYWNYLYDFNKTNFSYVMVKPKKNPGMSWALPYVTGHAYRWHFGAGIDFT